MTHRVALVDLQSTRLLNDLIPSNIRERRGVNVAHCSLLGELAGYPVVGDLLQRALRW